MWGFNPDTIPMTASEVMSRLPRDLVCDGRVTRTDNIYLVPLNPASIMKKIKSWKYDYIPEKRDCDAFVDIFRGELGKKGFGNLLAMVADVTLSSGDRHSLIGFMDLTRIDKHDKHPLIFGEPQTGKLIERHISNTYTVDKLRA